MSQGTKTVDEATDESTDERQPSALPYLDPTARRRLREAGITADTIAEKRVSYRELVDADLDPDVADRLRREESLPWSRATGDGDLVARSTQIRGLSRAERDWIAASESDWEATLTANRGSKLTVEGSSESPRRRSPQPDPVTDVTGIDERYADRLATGGITSVRSLAAADPSAVATALDLDRNRVTSWHWRARQLVGAFDFDG